MIGWEVKIIIKVIRSVYYNLTDGISNLIHWFPVIWRDREFDDHFIYVILHKKLERMEKFFNSKYAWTADAEVHVAEIQIAKDACKRIIDSKYFEQCLIPYDEKYGDKEYMWFEPDEDRPGWSKIVWTEDTEQMELRRQCGNKADELEKLDKDFLFEFIRKHIDGWWD